MRDKTEDKVDIPSSILSVGVATACMAIGLAVVSPMGDSPAAVINNNYPLVVGSFAALMLIIFVIVPVAWQAIRRHSK